jgi:hypothetical protein
MRRHVAALALATYLGQPANAQAPGAVQRDVLLSDPLYEWAIVLAIVLFGGMASWVNKARKGMVPVRSTFHFVGELTVAAFAGLLVFLGCKWLGAGQYITPAAAGLAGYMGGRSIELLERAFERRAKRILGLGETGPAPLSERDRDPR